MLKHADRWISGLACVRRGPEGERESSVQRGTLDPEWEEEIIFGAGCHVDQTAAIELLVLDRDTVGADDVCGRVEIPVDEKIHQMRRKRSQAQAMAKRRTSISGPLGPRSVSLGDVQSKDVEQQVALYEREEFELHRQEQMIYRSLIPAF